MPAEAEVVSLGDLFRAFARQLPRIQSSLDREYLQRLEEFRAVLAAAPVARGLAPARMAVRDMEFGVEVALVESRSRSFELGFRIAGAHFRSTFAYTQSAYHSLVVRIQAAPFPPMHQDETTSPLEA